MQTTMSTVLSTPEIEHLNLLTGETRLSPRSFTRDRYTNNFGEKKAFNMKILRCNPNTGYINSKYPALVAIVERILHLEDLVIVGEDGVDNPLEGRQIITAKEKVLTLRVKQSYPVQFPKNLVSKVPNKNELVLNGYSFQFFDNDINENQAQIWLPHSTL